MVRAEDRREFKFERRSSQSGQRSIQRKKALGLYGGNSPKKNGRNDRSVLSFRIGEVQLMVAMISADRGITLGATAWLFFSSERKGFGQIDGEELTCRGSPVENQV